MHPTLEDYKLYRKENNKE